MHVAFSGQKLSSVFEKRFLTLLSGAERRAKKRRTSGGLRHASTGSGGGALHRSTKRQFLVKWKNLSYAEMSWEDEDVIMDDDAIATYYRRARIPNKTKLESDLASKMRVTKYEQSPAFKNERVLRWMQWYGCVQTRDTRDWNSSLPPHCYYSSRDSSRHSFHNSSHHAPL
jgi:hypothetical protein